jgi:signal transduction histidine kinase/streptogramin lyase
MFKNKSLYSASAVSIAFVFLSSCSYNAKDIPFPEKELGYSKPVTVPLKLTPEKQLVWDTTKQGEIKPLVKKLDIDALPFRPYDTSGFKPFAKPAEEVRFDFNMLPGSNFNMASLPSKSLAFKTKILAPPVTVKTLPPVIQKNKPISIFDFGQSQGLPAKFITCLLKDRNGLMWIAGGEGVFRYDGEHVQTFLSGLGTKFVTGLAEDNNGRIWFMQEHQLGMIDIKNGTVSYSQKVNGTQNNLTKIFKDEDGLLWLYNSWDKAVSIIDPNTYSFKNLDRKAGLSDTLAFEILQDANKNIWISTGSGGVDIIDQKAGKIKYLKKSGGLSSDTLSALTIDRSGRVWISESSGGLNLVDIKAGTIKHQKSAEDKKRFTFDLSVDDKDRLWKATSNGIELIDMDKGATRIINTTSGMVGNVALACVPDNEKRMWVATVQGLNIIDQDAETVHPFAGTNIVSLMEDGTGNLWVATQKGVSIVNFQKNTVRLLDKSNGLSNDFVQSFFKINDKVVVATNGGFNIIDPVNKTMEIVGKSEGLVNDTIYSAFKDRSGNTWLTGPSNGADVVDSVKKIIRHVDVKGGLSDNNIQDIKQDNDGRVWLATSKAGVNIIDPIKNTVRWLNDQPGLKDTCNRVLVQDKQGRMWIGTDKGIYVADIKNGKLTSISTKEGLTNDKVLSLLAYNDFIAAGTNNKITIIKSPLASGSDEWQITPLNKSLNVIKETNSWSSDLITSKGQYLWGDLGITIINKIETPPDSVTTYITGINVMTQPQHFVNTYGLKEKDTLWAADTFYVKGQEVVKSGYTGAGKIKWDSVSGAYNLPADLEIPHDQNYIQFKFVQAHLGRQDTTWYSYVLEGIDKKWSAPTINTFTENYLNLPPGKYTFKVSSRYSNGRWGNPAVFNFAIAPPWYNTWWAYTIFVLVCAGIIRAYIVYRSRQLKNENRLLEEKVNQRTNQLQKSLEDLKATQTQLIQSEKMASLGELTAGIAHEIQNPLNFINNFSEVNTELIAEMKEEIEKGNLVEVRSIAEDIAANEEKINHHGKRADGIVKGMLLHSRTGNRQKEATDVNALADEYLRLAYHGLRAKDKSFNATMKTDFDERIGSLNLITQDIGRVILNLITNAFYAVSEKKKTQPEGYEPTVSVSTKKTGNKTEIRVKDNGNGIPQKVLDKIFQPFFTTKPAGEGTGLGLSLSYDIIKAHNGELKVETKEGEGAEFIIILPQ